MEYSNETPYLSADFLNTNRGGTLHDDVEDKELGPNAKLERDVNLFSVILSSFWIKI